MVSEKIIPKHKSQMVRTFKRINV